MSTRFSSISFHPKLVAVLDAVIGLMMLWWITQINSWLLLGLWFAIRLLFWFLFIRFVFSPPEVSRWRHFSSLAFFNLGMAGFILFTDWTVAWRLVGAIYILVPFISFWILPATRVTITALFKPHRRFRFVMALMAAAGIFEVVGAVMAYQIAYTVNHWVWMISASFALTALAGWWWWEYQNDFFAISGQDSPPSVPPPPQRRGWGEDSLAWLSVFFILTLELQWIFFLLPFGFQTNSLILSFLWYSLWVAIRFRNSEEGINWRKQRFALVFTVLLLIMFVGLVVRWK